MPRIDRQLPPPEPVEPIGPPLGRRTVLHQRWTDLAYLHWRYPPQAVQALLPADVRVDTFDGSAWVGLIPFVMRDVRIGPTPPVPYLGTFVEINVRTYVVDPRGRRAVWFFSLDVPRSAIVGVARSVFALPYCWSPGASHHVDGDGRHRYTMRRRWPRAGSPTADIGFGVGRPLADPEIGELEHFLSARWALVTERRGQLRYGRVAHPPWPLHELHDLVLDQDVVQAAGLDAPTGAPHAMFSPGVDVGVAWLDAVPRTT